MKMKESTGMENEENKKTKKKNGEGIVRRARGLFRNRNNAL